MEHPEHIAMETTNGSQFNIDALYQLFPSCFTEAADVWGKIHRAVDWGKLRELLGEYVESDEPEKYDFTWVGKRAAQREAAAPCRKTLRPCPEESVDWDTTQNLYIEGDNLEVLKLLQNSYMGKVKMIYIDPPYNTGNDFVYHDDFAQSAEEYDEHNLDDEGNRYRKNTDSNGRFHSDWCSMIYTRLMVARSLLTEDGVIFISIGVEELTTLKAICNEVFGEKNFVEIFSWVKTATPPSLAKKSRKTNEYVLCFEKNKSENKYNGEPLEGGDQPLLNTGNSIRVLEFPHDKVYFKEDKYPDGLYEPFSGEKVTLLDSITIRKGYSNKDFKLEGPFKWTQDFLNEELENGTTFIVKSKELSIRFIRTGEGFKRPTNYIKEKYTTPLIDKPNNGVGTNETASSYLNSLMDNMDVFSYPKPVSLIQYLTNFIIEENDIVMDFFAGSSTTADAVFRYNSEWKDKNVRFINVQLPENLDEALKTADTITKPIIENAILFCDKYNFSHVLTELGKERIRRAGKKIKADSPLTTQDLDIGFRVLKCDESNYKPVAFSPKDYTQESLDMFLDNIKEERTGLDLLFDCMMRWGLELSLPYATQKVDGCTIYNVDDGNLVACFNGVVTSAVIDAIAETHPLRVVFRDSSFTEAAQKMNLFELFKQKCGWTDQEVQNNVRVI